MVHLGPDPIMKLQHKMKGGLTRYRAMNCSIDGTSSPTNFSMVLYCDNSLVHAVEYLFGGAA